MSKTDETAIPVSNEDLSFKASRIGNVIKQTASNLAVIQQESGENLTLYNKDLQESLVKSFDASQRLNAWGLWQLNSQETMTDAFTRTTTQLLQAQSEIGKILLEPPLGLPSPK